MAGSVQKAAGAIDRAIKESTEVKPGNYVTVKAEKSGLFGKGKITLTGRTTSEKDKAKIEEIAAANAGDFEVESKLRVSSVG